ncbi:MAG TPA: 4Fe-4S binding protein [Paludibacteraceae bacterium]|jgi:formate hydrogenlyase subunit 6/NADH:ubiquinone oxidoreductase subunit I|nr:4Fe-4S binding protein [Prevotellaceae bacterium]HOU68207.1 4Fe-4S binding protein [Paludibacteraceae bacterium]HQF50079.1 4Fe-4S binding protein [Paludibacteraceae bacterium]HQJ91102.1 4Fe-4S binding protein [Paludibacteraceae bacterium]
MSKFKAQIENGRCVACGVCEKTCPREAIRIYKGCYADVNDALCIGCGLCAKACPAAIITRVERIKEEERD